MIFRVQKVIGFATRIQLQNTTAFFAKEAKEASKK